MWVCACVTVPRPRPPAPSLSRGLKCARSSGQEVWACAGLGAAARRGRSLLARSVRWGAAIRWPAAVRGQSLAVR